VPAEHTPASDEDQARSGRLLLLGKGAVLAHRLARPLAAESDEHQQSRTPGGLGCELAISRVVSC
jgi:hypothetical protein